MSSESTTPLPGDQTGPDAPKGSKRRPADASAPLFETRGGAADESLKDPKAPSSANKPKKGPPGAAAEPNALFAASASSELPVPTAVVCACVFVSQYRRCRLLPASSDCAVSSCDDLLSVSA